MFYGIPPNCCDPEGGSLVFAFLWPLLGKYPFVLRPSVHFICQTTQAVSCEVLLALDRLVIPKSRDLGAEITLYGISHTSCDRPTNVQGSCRPMSALP